MYNYVPEQEMIAKGYPAYTTSAGWLGYTDTQLRELCQKYLKAGWTRSVADLLQICWFRTRGSDLNDDIRRAATFREEIGWDKFLAMDAINAGMLVRL